MIVPIEKQIEDLAKVEISTDLIDKLDINQISSKAKEIMDALNISKDELDKLINQGFFSSLFGSLFGGNDKKLANAEKSLVDSAKFNIGLSCLLVLFSKAIKNQQDTIVDQQKQLKAQQEELKASQDDIRKLQGLTKEQADSILELLQAKDFVQNKIKDAEARINKTINNEISEVLLKINNGDSELTKAYSGLANDFNYYKDQTNDRFIKIVDEYVLQSDFQEESDAQSKELYKFRKAFINKLYYAYSAIGILLILILLHILKVILF